MQTYLSEGNAGQPMLYNYNNRDRSENWHQRKRATRDNKRRSGWTTGTSASHLIKKKQKD